MTKRPRTALEDRTYLGPDDQGQDHMTKKRRILSRTVPNKKERTEQKGENQKPKERITGPRAAQVEQKEVR